MATGRSVGDVEQRDRRKGREEHEGNPAADEPVLRGQRQSVAATHLPPRQYWRGAISIVVFLVLWEIGSLSKIWIKWEAFEWLRNLLVAFGIKPIYLPWIGRCRHLRRC